MSIGLIIGGGNPESRQKAAEDFLEKNTGENAVPLVIEINPEEGKNEIGIGDVRKTLPLLSLKTDQHQPKVLRIKEAGKLSLAAQNALLKTLEEPPDNTIIILEVPATDLLLPTVLSRCQIISLPSGPAPVLPENEKKNAGRILSWIAEKNIPAGFKLAEEFSKDRAKALRLIDQLILAAGQNLRQTSNLETVETIRRLQQTKIYLSANTNVRLTWENLFV